MDVDYNVSSEDGKVDNYITKKDICKYRRPCDDICVPETDTTFRCGCSQGHFLTLAEDNVTCSSKPH